MANKLPDIKVAISDPSDVRVVHKYKISLSDFNMFLVKSSVILDIAEQDGDVFMWVERPADGNIDCVGRQFEVFGTGHDIPPKARKFIKTLHHSSGLVLHYYELI